MEQRQITIVVAVIKNASDEILLAKRNEPETPEIDNKWEFPGGKIEFGEDPETAVVREVKEETGLNVKVKKLLPKIYSHLWDNLEKVYQVIILAYECEAINSSIANNDPKIKELKYFQLADINYDLCLPKMKEIIELLKS